MMTMELHDAVNGDGLMDIQGAGFHAIATLNTARETTVPAEVADFLEQFRQLAGSSELAMASAMEGLPSAVNSWKGYGSSLASRIASNCEKLLIQFAALDDDQPDAYLQTALEYLIDQMVSTSQYVTGNTVALALAADAGNSGDQAVLYTEVNGNGVTEENCLAEVVDLVVTTAGARPTLTVTSPAAQTAKLASDWPQGSGISKTVQATDPAASLLTNGDFEDEDDDDTPSDWILHVAEPGVTLLLTAPCVQTIVIAGTPTAGTWQILWEDAQGVTRATETLAYNAGGSTVQAALRKLAGLEKVTVSTTGTSPDYTHTIVFTGVGGEVNELTSVSHLSGSTSISITHDTTVDGNAGSYKGVALELLSDGAELTEIYHELSVTADTVYFCHLRARLLEYITSPCTTGEIRIAIVDEIDGSVVADAAGNDNELVIDVTAMSTTEHDSEWFSFRVPSTVSQPVYLRILVTELVDAGLGVFLDEICVVKGTQLYSGGPYVAVIAGVTPSLLEDSWTLTVTNDRAGKIQEWYERCFDMSGKGLLLPVSGAGTSPVLIPESVIG